jgi:hypothetical protein
MERGAEPAGIYGRNQHLPIKRNPWRAVLIHDNYVQGVAPATPDTLNFSGSGIVTDGDTADPLLATSSVEIANNQVVGCVTTGIALAFGLTRSPTITWSCLAA